MIIYAHRGASEYAPENTMSSFYLGLLQGANGIETDVQITKDGVLVLFHDDMLNRVTDATGEIADYTYEEIKRIKVFGNSVTGFYDHIVTFEQFLETFFSYDIRFAIELKKGNVEQGVIDLIKKYGIEHKVTLTSFKFDYLKKVKEIDPKLRIGWLVAGDGCENIERLKQIGGEEMAPRASAMTQESVDKLKAVGLGVRAWGVVNQDLMKRMCQFHVDGMTVNFPDRLVLYTTADTH